MPDAVMAMDTPKKYSTFVLKAKVAAAWKNNKKVDEKGWQNKEK